MAGRDGSFLSYTQPVELLVTVAKTSSAKSKKSESGKLRIGDDWNAIRIIALSQSNPLKAIAELVENSIDAHAKTIAITRGREQGKHFPGTIKDGAATEFPHRFETGCLTSSTSRPISATQGQATT